MAVLKPKKLKPKQLRWTCPPNRFKFKTTKEVESLNRIVGQPRAVEAIRMGAEISGNGFNTFVTGLSGTGRMTTVKRILENIQSESKCPDLYDYCYIHNFDKPQRPCLVRLRQGRGKKFARSMEESIEFLTERLPKVFDQEPYLTKRQKIIEKYQAKEQELLDEFDDKLEEKGFVRGQVEQKKGQSEPDIFPVIDDKAYNIDALGELVKEKKLTEKKAQKIAEQYNKLHEELIELAKTNMQIMKEFREELAETDKEAAKIVIDSVFSEVSKDFKKHEVVQNYLENGKDFILDHLNAFLPQKSQNALAEISGKKPKDQLTSIIDLFQVNVILDNTETDCAPVVIEYNPNYGNLFGSFERVYDHRGYWRTDFSKIKAGSILQADQGYLIVNAMDLFTEPASWAALKNVLLYGILEIQPYESFLQVSQSQLKPESIEVNVKVIIIGGQTIYNYLYRYEKGFKKIFKILAQFNYETERNDELIDNVIRFFAQISNEENIPHCNPKAASTLIEWAAKHAGSQDRITLKFSDIADLLRESAYFATKDNKKYISDIHVHQAIEKRKFRHDLLDEKIKDYILKGSTLIDTKGERVGQINGLTVMSTGIISFGKPARITATVGSGNRGIVNIEREAELSGAIYEKGALIIKGFFLERFAEKKPLTFSASIAFEQSYGGIDGDSASVAEIYVLLSALAEVPIKQNIAITGSINQMGDIQPIGGVNEKITGFYEICKERGFTGDQGVIIPHQNVKDLMLEPEIIEQVEKGNFTVYSISKIEEGSPLLMDLPFGTPNKKGEYKEGTLLEKVTHRLDEFYKSSKPFVEKNVKSSS